MSLSSEGNRLKFKEDIQFIAIEGVIGVGKTTLSSIISERFQINLLREEFEENPFLEKFYRDRDAYAFQTQVFFLLSRHKQFRNTFKQKDLFSPSTVSDYIFEKDRIFASLNLSAEEFSMYDKIAQTLQKDIVKPDFIVYLQANVQTLLNRIRKRNRSMELSIERDYIEELIEAYNHYFFHCTDCPVLIVNTDNIDFVKHEDDLEDLLKVISSLPRGTTYYSPTSKVHA